MLLEPCQELGTSNTMAEMFKPLKKFVPGLQKSTVRNAFKSKKNGSSKTPARIHPPPGIEMFWFVCPLARTDPPPPAGILRSVTPCWREPSGAEKVTL